MADLYLQMELRRGAAGDAGHGFAILDPVEAPDGGFAAPIGYILAVQIHAVLEFHAVPGHAPGHFCLIGHWQTGQPILPSRQQALPQELGLLRRKALLSLQQLTDGVIHHEGRVGQRRCSFLAQTGDKDPVFIQRHLIRVGKHVHTPHPPRRVVADVHGGAYRQHRDPLSLAGIGRRGQLWVPEGVHHPVIADPVAGSEVLVGGIVEHTPAKAPCVFLPRRVLHPEVAQGLLLPPCPGVEGLGGEHMAVALRDEEGLAHIRCNLLFVLGPGGPAVVREIVVGVYIFQQTAFFQIAHA